MPNPKPIGNKTDRRGRKLRRDIHLGTKAARSLRILTNQRKSINAAITEDQIVEELIETEWRKHDADYQQGAEWEGNVL